MPKYDVRVPFTGSVIVKGIEAATDEDAVEKAVEKVDDEVKVNEPDDIDLEDFSIIKDDAEAAEAEKEENDESEGSDAPSAA